MAMGGNPPEDHGRVDDTRGEGVAAVVGGDPDRRAVTDKAG